MAERWKKSEREGGHEAEGGRISPPAPSGTQRRRAAPNVSELDSARWAKDTPRFYSP